jgi:hypothetical protein
MHSVQPSSQDMFQIIIPLDVCLMRTRGIASRLLSPLMVRDTHTILPRHIRIYHIRGQRLASHLVAELDHLLQDHLAHLRHFVDNLKAEVKGGWTDGLVAGVVPNAEVGVLERLLYRDAGGWVEGEHLVQKVEGIRVCVGEETLERDFGHEGKVAHIFLRPWRADTREGFFVGGAEEVENLV